MTCVLFLIARSCLATIFQHPPWQVGPRSTDAEPQEGSLTTGTAAVETGYLAAISPEVSAGTDPARATPGRRGGGVGRIYLKAVGLVDGET